MGFRFRKSIRLAKGVRMNLSASKRGVTTGLSAGVPGYRLSVNSRGRVTTTAGLPGTGVSYVRSSQLGVPKPSPRQHLPVVTSPSSASTQSKQIGTALGLGILLFPYLFSWFVLAPGYSARSRWLSFGWMVILVIVGLATL